MSSFELGYKKRKRQQKTIDLTDLELDKDSMTFVKPTYNPDHGYHHGVFYPQCQKCVEREVDETIKGELELLEIGKLYGRIPKNAKSWCI